jgi:hypothetical protein
MNSDPDISNTPDENPVAQYRPFRFTFPFVHSSNLAIRLQCNNMLNIDSDCYIVTFLR